MGKFKQIIFTGGGSGGHVVPALTLIEAIRNIYDLKISYVGGRKSVERELVSNAGVEYYPIFTGKLRRYISFENGIDFFRFIFGVLQSFVYLLRQDKKSTLIFSTGGFVGLPLVIAGGILGFSVYIHEQTSRVGLANKIASYFANKIFISFEDSKKFFPANKTIFSGYPLRAECFTKRDEDYKFMGVQLEQLNRKIILITGGGNGSKLLNEFVKKNLLELKDEYFIIHQVGEKFIDEYGNLKSDNYIPVSFLDNIVELMKHAEIILTRAGAGTVMELIALKKKSIFVPLKIAQKNEQFHNASEAKKKMGSLVISEDELSNSSFKELIKELGNSVKANEFEITNGIEMILNEMNIK